MLAISDLVVVYPGTPPVLAVDGVSLEVPSGRTAGLVGESGSGKSTIGRAVAQIAPVMSGTIRVDGTDVTNARGKTLRALRRKLQLVFQDPHASLNPRMTVGRAVQEAASIAAGRPIGSPRCAERGRQLFELVRLPDSAAGSYPHQLSGGQLQRVALARALAVEPKCLVLDEVTASLDVSVQATMLNLLHDLQAELGLTYLYISHDLSIVRYLSEAVHVIERGRIVESGSVAELFATPTETYTKELLAAVPSLGGSRWRRRNHQPGVTTPP